MTPSNSMTVARRLGLTFAFLACLLGATASVGVWGLGRLTDALSGMFVENVKPMYQLGELEYLVTRNRVLLMDALMQAKPEVVEHRLK